MPCFTVRGALGHGGTASRYRCGLLAFLATGRTAPPTPEILVPTRSPDNLRRPTRVTKVWLVGCRSPGASHRRESSGGLRPSTLPAWSQRMLPARGSGRGDVKDPYEHQPADDVLYSKGRPPREARTAPKVGRRRPRASTVYTTGPPCPTRRTSRWGGRAASAARSCPGRCAGRARCCCASGTRTPWARRSPSSPRAAESTRRRAAP